MKFATVISLLPLFTAAAVDARVLPRAQCANTLSIAKVIFVDLFI